MEIGMLIALAIAIPIILIPVAFIWFLNITGILTVLKETRARAKKRAKAHKEALGQIN